MIKRINPDTVHDPFGYSHVAEVSGGRLIYTAGQVALDPAGNLVGEGDMAAQTHQVFENLKAILAAAGATFADVVKLTYFITDPSQVMAVREVRNQYIDADNPPASTLIVVAALARPEWLIEVEAIAALS